MAKDDKQPQTIIVWNDERVVVEHITGTVEDGDRHVAGVRAMLHRRHTDPRWQIVAGHLAVEVRK